MTHYPLLYCSEAARQRWSHTLCVTRCLIAAVLLAFFVFPANAVDTPPAAAIASAHPLATQAGLDILKAGGNAFDAAIAVTAMLAVVEPSGSGLGGGGFFLLHRAADGYQIMIDARETAPQQAHRDMYLDERGEVIAGASINGPLAAAIPGIPAALDHLARRFGRLPLRKTLAPAIKQAQTGFPVDEHYRRLAHWRQAVLRRYPAAAAVFLHDGEPPPRGTKLRQHDLAVTLTRLAEQGRSGFYEGDVAAQLVAGVRDHGGIWTLEDLRNYRVVEREPVTGRYGGVRIVSASPPSSGGVVMLETFNILSEYPYFSLPRNQQIHLLVEAMRRAYHDRAIYLGDPDFVSMPLDTLLHPAYAAGLRATIHPDRATPSALLPGPQMRPAGHHTSHFSILDREGNRVAATLSINLPFGSGFVAPGTGVLLNNEMDDFAIKPGTPNSYGLVGNEANAIAPGKRPLSSMSPTFLETADRIGIVGTPGGSRIISMVILATLAFAQADTIPRQWVSRPRFHHQYLPDEIQHEPETFDEEQMAWLTGHGHQLKPLNRQYGNMQAILWDRRKQHVEAASDPRGGGCAAVMPPAEPANIPEKCQ